MSAEDEIASIGERIHNLDVNRNIHADDQMYSPGQEQHYFGVGKSTAYVIYGALLARNAYPRATSRMQTILDYGCGYGRGARYIRAIFPSARIVGTDYIEDGVRWCVENFGYEAHVGPIPADTFDLIWLGSVFTHLPETVVRQTLVELTEALRPGGLLIFSTQGRHCVRRIEDAFASGRPTPPWFTYNLPRVQTEILLEKYNSGKYAYVDYPGQNNYGVSFVPLSWYLTPGLLDDRFSVVSMQEKALDSHQDIVAIVRADIRSSEKGVFFRQ
jgi:SAM-dependent methyltransferase